MPLRSVYLQEGEMLEKPLIEYESRIGTTRRCGVRRGRLAYDRQVYLAPVLRKSLRSQELCFH